ncbi:MAG: hypothetical protein AAF698_09285, partial [Pseudomonadota bacterium]
MTGRDAGDEAEDAVSRALREMRESQLAPNRAPFGRRSGAAEVAGDADAVPARGEAESGVAAGGTPASSPHGQTAAEPSTHPENAVDAALGDAGQDGPHEAATAAPRADQGATATSDSR